MAAIAEHYLEGQGVTASKDKAATWFQRALQASKASSTKIDPQLLSRLAHLASVEKPEL
jgi:TPR repeat protein